MVIIYYLLCLSLVHISIINVRDNWCNIDHDNLSNLKGIILNWIRLSEQKKKKLKTTNNEFYIDAIRRNYIK